MGSETIKDLDCGCIGSGCCTSSNMAWIKEKTIKWVKEDKKDFDIDIFNPKFLDRETLLKRWMKRLDIKPSDLGEDNER